MTRAVWDGRPRAAKLFRDLRAMRGRVVLMVVAVAIALAGVGSMLVARAVVSREATAAYAGTNPASATLDVAGGVDADLLARVRQRPGILDATARQTISTRVRVGDEWRRMLLFVVDPGDPLRVARFSVESGAWPAPADALLIERVAGTVLSAGPGDTLTIAGPDGATAGLRIAGTVYDPALAPATQERTGYGYLTPAAAARLGFPVTADQLKIVTGREQSIVDSTARDLAEWLASTGHPVHQITAPPYRHPHQSQTNTVTGLFLGFALAALLLAGVLVATTLGGMLAAQTRQIGVMKTVGATTGQLLRLYLTGVVAIASAATVLAVGPAVLAGQALTNLIAELLNIDLASRTVPVWVFVTLGAAGIGVPVLVALVPLIRAARLTVRAALDAHGANAYPKVWLKSLRIGRRAGTLAVRNLLRRRARFIATVALLAAGGALFTTGLNTSSAWQSWVDEGLSRRDYTSEIQFTRPVAISDLAVATRISGVTATEPVLTMPATPAAPAGPVEVQRTYPDGGHGRFSLTALPAGTTMVRFDTIAGRWLRDDDTDGLVLNQSAATRLGNPTVGADVHLDVEGRRSSWRVVGIVAEVGGTATVYTAAGSQASATGLRLRTTGDAQAITDEVESSLTAAGVPVATTMLTTELRSAVDEHVMIFIYTLVALAALMAVVGVLGLAASMTISVTERTREYGIMQTIGATPAIVRRLVLTEGVLTGVAGCAVAIALSVPMSASLGDLLGRLSFGLPLPSTVSYPGLALWVVLAVAGAAVATLGAAMRAARLTVRETLSYQ